MSVNIGAIFSEDRVYRYSLWRYWTPPLDGNFRRLIFIGLNPSTADENTDDPTIRRCIGFAERLGYNGIVMLNLFAFRATKPSEMFKVSEPIGKHNDTTIKSFIDNSTDFVAAWGVYGSYLDRDKEMAMMIPDLLCLGTTKYGNARHPMYLKSDTNLEPWRKQ